MAQKKILIVDDSEDMRAMLESRLAEEGFAAITAPDGKEGLQAARKHKPDLILLDLNMPGMDGGEVGQALKEDPSTRDIPVIFLTGIAGDGSAPNQTSVHEVGGRRFLYKPFRFEVLLNEVRKLA